MSMLDDALGTYVFAADRASGDAEARLAALEAQLDTAKTEAEGLAKAVFRWHTMVEIKGDRLRVLGAEDTDALLDQALLRTAEILGYEGMADGARQRLAGQTSLL